MAKVIKTKSKFQIDNNKVAFNNSLDKVLRLTIVIVCFLLYANTLNHDYTLDDFGLIGENKVTTKGIKSIPEIFSHFYRYGYYTIDDGIYRPVSVAMFAIEWSISPNNPHLSHLINILLYCLSGFILFKVLSKLLINYNLVLPFLIVMLFIANPVHTEVVASIKSRDEILCLLFSFLSLNSFLNYVNFQSKIINLLKGVLFFSIAIFSKENAITMSVLIPISLYFFCNTTIKQLITISISVFSVIIIFLIIRHTIISSDNNYVVTFLENPILATSDKMSQIATAISILGKYLLLLVLPNNLVYDRSYNLIPVVNITDFSFLISLIIYIIIIIYAFIGFKRKNILAYGLIFYLISISIYSNLFFKVGVAMADRFLYLPSIGFEFALVFILVKITNSDILMIHYNKISDLFSKNKKMILLSTIIFVLYTTKTISRNMVWKNNYSLFSADIKSLDKNARAHLFLGNELIRNISNKELDKTRRDQIILHGINEVEKSLQIYSNNPDAWNTLGGGYFKIDSLDKAAYYFQKAAKNNPEDLQNLVAMYIAKNEYLKAIEILENLCKAHTVDNSLYINLGICYGTIKKYPQAIEAFNKALSQDKQNPNLYLYLASAYKFNGDSLNYKKIYQLGLVLDPNLPRP